MDPSSPIGHKTCAVMFGAGWLSILILLIDSLVAFQNDPRKTVNMDIYHKCIFTGRAYHMDFIFLLIIPFTLIVLMYVLMLFTIVRTKRSCGRFLVLSTAIIGTNILCFTPMVTRIFVTEEMSYSLQGYPNSPCDSLVLKRDLQSSHILP